MKPEDYIKAWAEMNLELEKEDPGILLIIPTVEQTQIWIDESKRTRRIDTQLSDSDAQQDQ